MRCACSIVLIFAMVSTTACAAEGVHARYQFGAGAPRPGYAVVTADSLYSNEKGYGLEPGASLTVSSSSIRASQPFSFSVAVPEGNYRVTVTLGDPAAPAVTTVKAESRRLMLERIRTGAGESVRRTFVVNVRGPKLRDGTDVRLDPRERDPQTGRILAKHWDDKLTLTFADERPAVAAVEIEKADDLVTLYLTGDSTVTDQQRGPNSSWGQLVTRWFTPAVGVANHAESGETLKGFLKERRWDKVLESLKPGDYVSIEFGTNDSKASGPQNIYPGQDFSETHAPAETTYKELLRRFVADVRQRGGHPFIVSSSARRGEVKKPTSLSAWAEAAMAVARELEVPAIDLNSMGVQLNQALGAEADRQFADRTHHTEYGAYLQAKCIVHGIRQAGIPLAKHVVDDFVFDPAKPTPTPAEFDLPVDSAPKRPY